MINMWNGVSLQSLTNVQGILLQCLTLQEKYIYLYLNVVVQQFTYAMCVFIDLVQHVVAMWEMKDHYLKIELLIRQ
jgi:hypothetical protein